MSKMIQLRHVPDAVHRKLKARAAMKGMSLSDYLVREVTQLTEQPTIQEVLSEIRKLSPVEWREPVVETLRRMRESR
jgi:plasmid stability protein